MKPQTKKVLGWLQAGNTLTSQQARKLFGIDRLAARVRECRDAGHDVLTTMIRVRDKKVVGRYSLGVK